MVALDWDSEYLFFMGFDSKYLSTIFFFYVDARTITWVKNILEKLDNQLCVKVKKCAK